MSTSNGHSFRPNNRGFGIIYLLLGIIIIIFLIWH